jgi:signal peptidase I
MRANAANWLELADKVHHYRRDQLSETERGQLVQRMEALRGQLRDKADASKLKLGIEGLEGVLRRVGGPYYPKSTIQEYVEFFLVAAIVVLGVRTYFLQPFKIPTNSMYPTYYGMTPETYPDADKGPSAAGKAFRFATMGAVHKNIVAPESGRVVAPVQFLGGGVWRIAFRYVKGRKWLIIPTTLREYTFLVNETPVSFTVPGDFDFDWALREALQADAVQLTNRSRSGSYGVHDYVFQKPAEKGKSFLRFDVLTGDQLFVDRFSYHFFPPKVGEGFVFRTGNIPALHAEMPPGTPKDQYYIKRLAGAPGDTLEIREPVLYRNNAPATGAEAFDKNAHREGKYQGYVNLRRLGKGDVVTVPKNSFMALGDNSPNSMDSRYWGFVPAKDVVGRPLFIYFPFTRRWGLAH